MYAGWMVYVSHILVQIFRRVRSDLILALCFKKASAWKLFLVKIQFNFHDKDLAIASEFIFVFHMSLQYGCGSILVFSQLVGVVRIHGVCQSIPKSFFTY